MLYQSWIVKNEIKLLSVHHWPVNQAPIGTVLLLPGFSHSMCDVDYFMSKLARQLMASGFFVSQIDLRGHGDSGGDFSDVDIKTMRKDIEVIIEHYANQFSDKIFCIGRGLSAALLAELSTKEGVSGVAGIAPYCVTPEVIERHFVATNDKPIDAFYAFPGNDYVNLSDFDEITLCVLNALGVVPYNIHGMELSSRFLKELAAFDPLEALRRTEGQLRLWLFPQKDNQFFFKTLELDKLGKYPDLKIYLDVALYRDPRYQSKAISLLKDWVLSKYQLN